MLKDFPFLQNVTHKRYNPLIDEWVLVSPHRTRRPWQGKHEELRKNELPVYDEKCYLCPGNERAGGKKNPDYDSTFTFVNDFSALTPESNYLNFEDEFFKAETESGICKVICFSPNHSLSIPELSDTDILNVVEVWREEYSTLGLMEDINHVQIFENKGDIMGCSNPHPHGQIWAQHSIPDEVAKEDRNFKNYFNSNKRTLLEDYLKRELSEEERIVIDNEHFTALVPFWAVWPFETIIISKRRINSLLQFSKEEELSFAKIIKSLTTKYDNIFEISFPYSSGIHQAPTNNESNEWFHFHMHFYPPLLRSATVKKFMVGYEMLASPQRDITAEKSAQILREQSDVHYKSK